MTSESISAPADDARELIDALSRQRALYEQLQTLGGRQSALIAEGATEQLLGLLGERQRLVDQLADLSSGVAPLRERWPRIAAQLDTAQRTRIDDLLEQVEALLADILKQDEADRRQLQDAKQRIAGDLQRGQRGGQAMAAYRSTYGKPGGSVAPRFTDNRG